METKEFTATAGGGAVEVTVSGSKKLVKVKLDEEVVDPDDVEMLEDLLVAAVNEALEKVDAETTSAMSKSPAAWAAECGIILGEIPGEGSGRIILTGS